MKLIFITLDRIDNIEEPGIYHDILSKFYKENHEIYIVSPNERRFGKKTKIFSKKNLHFISVWTPNIQKAGLVEKIFSTLFLEYFFIRAVKKYVKKFDFDLILYSTPPITLTNIISFLKKKSNAFCYLLLKDIFPQNAVDLRYIKSNSFLHKIMRKKEKKLYKISDKIGCMSKANIKYLIDNNSEINRSKIEENPNSADLNKILKTTTTFSNTIVIPNNKVIFVYGGNLGKPQGIRYLISNIEECKDLENAFFLIIGSGTEFSFIKKIINEKKLNNVKLINQLSKFDFESILIRSDIGIVSLDPNFTIPNFPSRMIPYMKYKLPILFAVDNVTDCGKIASKNKFGLSCINGDTKTFKSHVNFFINNKEEKKKMGEQSFKYLSKNYNVKNTYNLILNNFKN